MPSSFNKHHARKVLDSIRQIVRALRVSPRGLPSAQLFVLQKLETSTGVSLNELSEQTFTHQSSVSVVVARLVERGLVSRKPSRKDRRRLELALTAKGQKILKSAPKSPQDALLGALLKLPPTQLKNLADSLSRATKDAGFAQTKAPMFFEEKS